MYRNGPPSSARSGSRLQSTGTRFPRSTVSRAGSRALQVQPLQERDQNMLANVDEESEDVEMTTTVKRRLGMHAKPLVAGPPPSAEEGGDAVIAWAMTFAKAQGLKGQAATEVAAKLAEAELSKSRLGEQLSQWSSCASELEGLLREKQEEVARLQGARGAPAAAPPSQGGMGDAYSGGGGYHSMQGGGAMVPHVGGRIGLDMEHQVHELRAEVTGMVNLLNQKEQELVGKANELAVAVAERNRLRAALRDAESELQKGHNMAEESQRAMVELLADQKAQKVREELRYVEEAMRAAEAKSAAAADEMTVQMNRRSTAERLLAEAEAANQAQARRVAEAVQMEHELHACRAALQSCEGLLVVERRTVEEREGAIAGMRNSLIEMEGELRTKKHALSDSESEARMLHDRLKDSLDKLQRVEGKIADAEAETNKVVSERDAHAQTIIFLKEHQTMLEARSAELQESNSALRARTTLLEEEAEAARKQHVAAITDKSNELIRVEGEKLRVMEELETVSKRFDELQRDLEGAKAKLLDKEVECESAHKAAADVSRVKSDLAASAAEIERLSRDSIRLKETESQLDHARAELNATASKLTALEEETLATKTRTDVEMGRLQKQLADGAAALDTVSQELLTSQGHVSDAKQVLLRIIQEQSNMAMMITGEGMPLKSATDMLEQTVARMANHTAKLQEQANRVPDLEKEMEGKLHMIDTLSQNVARLDSALSEKSSIVDELNKDRGELRQSLDRAEQANRTAQSEIARWQSELDRETSRANELQEKATEENNITMQVLRGQVEEQRAQIEEQRARLQQADGEVGALNQELNQRALENDGLNSELSVLKEDAHHMSSELMLRGDELNAKADEIRELEKELQRVHSMHQHERGVCVELTQKLEDAKQRLQQTEHTLGEQQKEWSTQAEDFKSRLAEAEGAILTAQDAQNSAGSEIGYLRGELADKQKTLAALEKAEDDLEDRNAQLQALQAQMRILAAEKEKVEEDRLIAAKAAAEKLEDHMKELARARNDKEQAVVAILEEKHALAARLAEEKQAAVSKVEADKDASLGAAKLVQTDLSVKAAALEKQIADLQAERERLRARAENAESRLEKVEFRLAEVEATDVRLLHQLEAERKEITASQMAQYQAQGREQGLHKELEHLREEVVRLSEIKMDLETKLDKARSEAATAKAHSMAEKVANDKIRDLEEQLAGLGLQLKDQASEIGQLKAKVDARNVELSAATETERLSRLRIESLTSQLQETKQSLAMKEVEYIARQEECVSLGARLVSSEATVASLREKLHTAEDRAINIESAAGQVTNELRAREVELEQMRARLGGAETNLSVLSVELAHASNTSHRDSSKMDTLEAQVRELKGQLSAKELDMSRLRGERDGLHRQLADAQGVIHRCEEEVAAAHGAQAELKEEMQELRERLQQVDAHRREATAQLRVKEAQLRSAGVAGAGTAANDAALQRRVAELEAREDSLLSEVSSLQNRVSSSTQLARIGHHSHNSFAGSQDDRSHRRMQNLLYSREKDLRRSNERIETLQHQVHDLQPSPLSPRFRPYSPSRRYRSP